VDIPAGHILTRNDISIKSPNDGIPPYEIEKMIGEKLPYTIKKDEAFSFINQ
jgi:sialic acid synthase